MLCVNRIDFNESPFIAAPNRADARYVYGHYCHRDGFPVLVFPAGVPAIGEAVLLNIHTDERLAHEKNAKGGDALSRYPNRVIIRIKRLAEPQNQPRFNLVYVPRRNGHTGGMNGGAWDTKIESTVKVWEWSNLCSGGKWWEWFTMAVTETPSVQVRFQGSVANGTRNWDETHTLEVYGDGKES